MTFTFERDRMASEETRDEDTATEIPVISTDETLDQEIQSRPGVARTGYISRAQALEEFRKLSGFADALDLLGDNPLVDIAGANHAGWLSVLVHTGVSTLPVGTDRSFVLPNDDEGAERAEKSVGNADLRAVGDDDLLGLAAALGIKDVERQPMLLEDAGVLAQLRHEGLADAACADGDLEMILCAHAASAKYDGNRGQAGHPTRRSHPASPNPTGVMPRCCGKANRCTAGSANRRRHSGLRGASWERRTSRQGKQGSGEKENVLPRP